MTHTTRRAWLVGALVAATWAAGCTTNPTAPTSATTQTTPQAAAHRAQLAPSGALKVGVYMGSPTSMVLDKNQQKVGVSYELGQLLAQTLGVPFQAVEFKRVAEIVDAMKNGEIDFTVTNASAARALVVAFSEPIIRLELGYLVPGSSPIQRIDDVDTAPHKVGVSEGSSSQGVLSRAFKQAVVVPQASIPQATTALQQGRLDAFATNKAILFEMQDQLPGARLLAGRWGLEHMAMAIPKGREAALPFLNSFAATAQTTGQLQRIVVRSGLRGTL